VDMPRRVVALQPTNMYPPRCLFGTDIYYLAR
jgi:hypothetical protein